MKESFSFEIYQIPLFSKLCESISSIIKTNLHNSVQESKYKNIMLRKFSKLIIKLKQPQKTPQLFFYWKFQESFSTKNKTEVEKMKESAKEEIDQVSIEGSELKKHEIDKMIEDRKTQLLEISKEKEIPYGALFSALLLTTPVIAGSIALNSFAYYGMFLEDLPHWFSGYIKYSGLHLSFLSGIHWGFAMSEHDTQSDPERSTPFVRKYFILGALPLILSFSLTGNIIYNFTSTSLDYKIYNLVGLIALHITTFLGDCFMYGRRSVPYWYLKLKLYVSILTVLSLSGICLLLYTDESKIRNERDPLRRFVPNQQEILKIGK